MDVAWSWHRPALLWGLPLALVFAVWYGRRAPALPLLGERWLPARPGARTRLAALARASYPAALLLLLIAAAGPRVPVRATVAPRAGRTIVLAVDRSGSMERHLVGADGTIATRMEAVRRFARAFVRAREADRIGLVGFARFADLVCPPTFDHAALLPLLARLGTVAPFVDAHGLPVRERARSVGLNPENATAIGEAVTEAVLALVDAPATATGYRERGRAVVLITDGENNAGIPPERAASLAATNGVRVHGVLVRPPDLAAPRRAALRRGLEVLAQRTGGQVFEASDERTLQAVCTALERLEATPPEEAVQVLAWRSLAPFPLGAAIVLLSLGLLLRTGAWRELP